MSIKQGRDDAVAGRRSSDGPAPSTAISSTAMAPLGVIRDEDIPRALRVLAILFVLLGVMVVVEVLITWVVYDVNVVAGLAACVPILAGRRLLQLREGWRKFMVFCVGCWVVLSSLATLAAVLSLVVVLITFLVALMNGKGVQLEDSPPVAGFLVLGILPLSVWMMSVLMRAEVVALFENVAEGRAQLEPAGPFQFRLRTLLLAMVVAAFAFQRIAQSDVLYERTSNYDGQELITRGKVVYSVQFIRHRLLDQPEQVDYFCFAIPTPSKRARMSIRYGPENARALVLPDDSTLELGGDVRLVEIVGDEVRKVSDELLTREELEAYQESGQAEYTMKDLLDFVRRYRAAAKRR